MLIFNISHWCIKARCMTQLEGHFISAFQINSQRMSCCLWYRFDTLRLSLVRHCLLQCNLAILQVKSFFEDVRQLLLLLSSCLSGRLYRFSQVKYSCNVIVRSDNSKPRSRTLWFVRESTYSMISLTEDTSVLWYCSALTFPLICWPLLSFNIE